MIHKDSIVAAITKDGAAEFSNISRRFPSLHDRRKLLIRLYESVVLSVTPAAHQGSCLMTVALNGAAKISNKGA